MTATVVAFPTKPKKPTKDKINEGLARWQTASAYGGDPEATMRAMTTFYEGMFEGSDKKE